MASALPVVDMSAHPDALAREIGKAARGVGFFYVTGACIGGMYSGNIEIEARHAHSFRRETPGRDAIHWPAAQGLRGAKQTLRKAG